MTKETRPPNPVRMPASHQARAHMPFLVVWAIRNATRVIAPPAPPQSSQAHPGRADAPISIGLPGDVKSTAQCLQLCSS
jgi:hypothetical protein